LRSRGSGGAGWKGNLGAAGRSRSTWPEFFAKRIRSYAPTVNEMSFAGDEVSALPTTPKGASPVPRGEGDDVGGDLEGARAARALPTLRMQNEGSEGRFDHVPPARLTGRCRIGQDTFAGAYSGDGLAP